MSGIKYLVDIEMNVTGEPGQKMAGISAGASTLKRDMAGVGRSLLDGFTGAVESIGGKLLTLGKIGAAGAIGAATYGVVGLNNELETTRVSLGAVLNANGMSSSLESGMKQASGWITQMKKDAKDLPGEFSDLLAFVQNAASPAFAAGLDMTGFEKMSAQAMAAAKSLQVPMDQAAREYAQLLEGRAGAHNVFGTRLGIHAQGFNEKGSEDRVKIIQSSLGKFEPAIAEFGKTFDASSSALVDSAKQFLTTATGPLFGKVKDALGDANSWLDKNSALVADYAERIGYQLGKAFDYGKEVFLEYGPLLLDFGERAYDKIVRVWQDLQPIVHDVGDAIKGFLKDDGSFDKIETILKLYITAKGLGAAASAGSTIYKLGTGIAGLFGGGGGAATAAAGAAGAGEVGAGVVAIEAGVTGFAAAGASLSATLLAVPLAIGAAIGATIYEIQDAKSRELTVDAMGGGAYGYNDAEKASREKMIASGIEAGVTLHGLSDIPVDSVGIGFSEVGDAANTLAFTLRSLAKSGDFDAVRRINEAIDKDEAKKKNTEETNNAAFDFFKTNAAAAAILGSQAIDKAKAEKEDAAKRKKNAEGKGGMTINKVEITVNNNNSPEQVARATLAEMQHLRRLRTSSSRTLNFSAGH